MTSANPQSAIRNPQSGNPQSGNPQLVLQLATATPLVPLEAVYALRAISAEEAETLVQTGQLGWCFDIAMPGAARSEIRVLRDSLLGFADITLDQAIDTILPRAETLHAKFVARRWCCSPSHIANLVRAGFLIEAVGARRATESPRLIRAFLGIFLRKHVIGSGPAHGASAEALALVTNKKKFGL